METSTQHPPTPSRLTDPAVWIAVFFGLLILANVAFFAVALTQPSDALPPAASTDGGSGAAP